MRTTVDIPDDLYQVADAAAAREGIPLHDLITQGLRLAVGETRPAGHGRIGFPLLHSARPGTLNAEEVRAAENHAIEQEDAARAGAV
jgi:hypothetical protein